MIDLSIVLKRRFVKLPNIGPWATIDVSIAVILDYF
jgi:hypothetical protein